MVRRLVKKGNNSKYKNKDLLNNWAKVIDISLIGFCDVSKNASADLLQVKKLISDIKQKIFLKKIK